MFDYLIALTSIASILVWLALALLNGGFLPKAEGWLREPGNSVRLATWLIAAMVVVVTLLSPENTLLGSLRSEAISTAFAVIVLNELAAYRAGLQEKRHTIEQIGSRVNDAALEGVRLARRKGWMEDGSLKDANFQWARLDGANLQSANLAHTDLTHAYLTRAFVRHAHLEHAKLQYVNMERADLWFAYLQSADLRYALLKEAGFRKAHMQHALLSFANLENAILGGADLRGANLVGATLRGTDLAGAVYDDKTVWPSGFDPVTAGATLIGDRILGQLDT